MVRHGVEGWARAAAVTLAWWDKLWPLATETRVSLGDKASRFVVWGEEVEEEEKEVYGKEDAIDEEASERRAQPSRHALERNDCHRERRKGERKGWARG